MTAVLNWIKANWLIVGLSALMLICLPAFFVGGEFLNKGVREAIDTRANKKVNEIKRAMTTQIEITPLMPGAKPISEQVTLNENILDQYEVIKTQIRDDAGEIIQTAIDINSDGKRVLLEGLYPQPSPEMAEYLPYKVHEEYVKAHEQLVENVMQAGMPVPPDDLALQLKEYEETYLRTQMNVETTSDLKVSEREQLLEAMTKRRLSVYSQTASDVSVYADKEVFHLEEWDSQASLKPSEAQRFNWMHQFWVNQDIARAVRLANTGSDGQVMTIAGASGGVVKRIVDVQMSELAPNMKRGGRKPRRSDTGRGEGEGDMSEGGGMMDGGSVTSGGKGAYFQGKGRQSKGSGRGAKKEVDLSNPAKKFQTVYTKSISGRIPNALYDIRNVDITLIVDSHRLFDLLDAFNQTNFMTVVGMKVSSVDTLADLSVGYYYGDEAVVQVDLTVETTWLRDWSTLYMSDEVKEWLNIPVEDKDEDKGKEEDEESKKGDSRRGGG